MVFVFGSNEGGIHGRGAARYALHHHGAIWRQGFGRMNNSFAIPTKNKRLMTLGLYVIANNVWEFIEYAKITPNEEFQVTRIGCGLAGYKDEHIAPMFRDAPDNCLFDQPWLEYLRPGLRAWNENEDADLSFYKTEKQ